MTARAVILARGLGTRMRQEDRAAPLSAAQAEAAASGLKAMMPMHGRPFLDYALSALADAAITRVALVVAPEHDALRRHYLHSAPPARVSIDLVVQPEPLGTANATTCVAPWTAGEPFLVMNGDNLYPVQALRDLASLDEPGLPVFERGALVASGNIPAERVGSFAVLEIDRDGYLTGIVEKPGDLPREDLPPEGGSHGDLFVSMNCWRFDSRIFDACRDVPRSARGEFELPEAVGLAVRRGVRFKTLPGRGPVLDLSRRADAADVERRLAGVVPRP
jgi:glucose-1-phosphate thymidylyltransferase